MRLVVSGATGFLGGHLCRYLSGQGHEVIGLGRDSEKGAGLGARFEAVDLSTSEALNGVSSADAFVHCAALSSNWGRRIDFERANVTGTRNALAIAERMGVKRFVHISSPTVAFRFRDQLNLSEDAPLPGPVNAYAASKQHAERLVRARPEISPIILRPRGIYGPGDSALLPRLLRAAQSGALPLINHGETVTDLTYVDDVVRAIALALTAPDICNGRTYNISGGEPLSIKAIITQAAQAAKIPVSFTGIPRILAMTAARIAEFAANMTPGRPEPLFTAYSVGVMAYSQTLDISAARRDLGYTPHISFADGLRRTFS